MTAKIELQDAFKKVTADQDKIISPEETVQRFKARLRDIDLDILEQTRRIDNGRLGIPVFFSQCGVDAQRVTGTRKQMGKGATPAQAEASAVMELAERFSFFSFSNSTANFTVDTYANVADRAIPFEMIARSVHDTSDDLAITRKVFEALPLKWTRGYNLSEKRAVLIPFDWFFAINEFNGPSAGNCVEEALIQGICEVVERHTSSIISRDRIPIPAIRADSADQPLVKEMIAKYRRANIRFCLSDFSLDMGIPTVGMLAWDPATFPDKSEIVWTAGTTPDPQKALSRTLTEVAQLAGDFNTGANYVASGLPKFGNISEASFVTDAPHEVDISSLPNLANNNIRLEVENCIDALAKRGMEVMVIDTMHPRLRIPAFYTIIPGAHFRERALGTSVGMFAAKLILEKFSAPLATNRLLDIDRLLPGKYYLQFYLGCAQLSMENPDTALEHFQRSLDMGPNAQDTPSIYSYMGVCLKDMGRYPEALKELAKGEALDQRRTDIYNLKGFCHFKLKQHEEAIANFKKVLQLDPGSAIDYANIATNYRELGDIKQAIEYYHLALAIDPSIEFAQNNLKQLLQNKAT